MESVFFCGDCNKFFYSDSNQVSAECLHCKSKTTINCQTTKEQYAEFTDSLKTRFKTCIRDKYPTKAAMIDQCDKLEKQLQLKNFKLTTGFDFQGYVVTEYIDVLFDEILVGLGFVKSIISGFDNLFSAVAGTEATAMIDKLNDVKNELKQRLIYKAMDMGANAMLGIDFESSKLGDLIMVSMTGTAVKIEKSASKNEHI